jgi:hypothetical protein
MIIIFIIFFIEYFEGIRPPGSSGPVPPLVPVLLPLGDPTALPGRSVLVHPGGESGGPPISPQRLNKMVSASFFNSFQKKKAKKCGKKYLNNLK